LSVKNWPGGIRAASSSAFKGFAMTLIIIGA
jgi:hypothetical protein